MPPTVDTPAVCQPFYQDILDRLIEVGGTIDDIETAARFILTETTTDYFDTHTSLELLSTLDTTRFNHHTALENTTDVVDAHQTLLHDALVHHATTRLSDNPTIARTLDAHRALTTLHDDGPYTNNLTALVTDVHDYADESANTPGTGRILDDGTTLYIANQLPIAQFNEAHVRGLSSLYTFGDRFALDTVYAWLLDTHPDALTQTHQEA